MWPRRERRFIGRLHAGCWMGLHPSFITGSFGRLLFPYRNCGVRSIPLEDLGCSVRSLLPVPRAEVSSSEDLECGGCLSTAMNRVDELSVGEQRRVGIARAQNKANGDDMSSEGWPDERPLTTYPPGVIDGPAAWKGSDFAGGADYSEVLAPADIAQLEEAADQTLSQGVPTLQMTQADFPLPTMSDKLHRIRTELLEGRGFSVLRGIPVDRYDVETLTRIYWGISIHIGEPVPQNKNSHMLGHIIDIGTAVDDFDTPDVQTSADLQFHADGADVVGLLCVKTARSGGESLLVSGITVHNEMLRRDPELYREFFTPYFSDRRGVVPYGKPPWFSIPPFNWYHNRFSGCPPLYVESVQRFDEVPNLTGTKLRALEVFREICADDTVSLRMGMQPGDLQFINNVFVFHSRTSYVDYDEPQNKRHLIRIWLSLAEGQELPPAFEDRWITIEKGRRRGGVTVPNQPRPIIPLIRETPAYN